MKSGTSNVSTANVAGIRRSRDLATPASEVLPAHAQRGTPSLASLVPRIRSRHPSSDAQRDALFMNVVEKLFGNSQARTNRLTIKRIMAA
jgi:hypothetical protein